jgi:hypothetical protein
MFNDSKVSTRRGLKIWSLVAFTIWTCIQKIILKLTITYQKTMNTKSMLTAFMLLLSVIGSSMVLSVPLKISEIQAQGQNTTLTSSAVPSTINVTIGELIVEGSGVPAGLRVLDVGTEDKGPKIEVSYVGNATIRGDINAMDMGTLWSITNPDGTVYSEGQGILTSTTTGEMATYTFKAIGQNGPDGKLRNHGAIFFNSSASPSVNLSFLNNMIGVYADEIDAAGNSVTRIWELR